MGQYIDPISCRGTTPLNSTSFAGIIHFFVGEILTCLKEKQKHFSSSNIDRVRAVWKQRKGYMQYKKQLVLSMSW